MSIPGGPTLVGADPVVEADPPIGLDVGEHRLRIDIESLALNPGSYGIGSSIARGESGRAWSVFDSIEGAIHLDLEADLGAGPFRGQAIVPSRSTLTRLT